MEQKVTKAEAAKILDVHVRTLERWARAGLGPRQIPLGPRLVRYDRDEVLEYLRTGEHRGSA